ncbi:MAG: DUF1799 domain-containing protein [Alphaproteobacteria bacterium]|nr:DUF1799 domain-containing protein [Alphaproteobacteria bacterium]
MGFDPAEAARWRDAAQSGRAGETETVEIWPDNLDAARLFFALGSQWRTGGLAGAPLGLDYAAIEPACRLLEIAPTPALFEDLQAMEAAARDVMLERFEERLNP